MRRSSWCAIVLGTVLAVGSVPARVAAESALWTLVASPLTATTGVTTTFSLTATNADPLADLLSSSEIGCVVVDVPSNFAVASATVSASNTGNTWVATLSGNRVRVRTTSGGNRLGTLDWVRFTVTAMPTSTGQLAWGARAYRDQNCGGSGALVDVPPVVVVTGSAVTPTPSSAPTPTLAPLPTLTPAPTLAPLPTLTPVPTLAPLPTLGPAPTLAPLPTLGPAPTSAPTPGPGRSPDASPSASEEATPIRPSAPGAAGTPPPGEEGGSGAPETASPSGSPAPGTGAGFGPGTGVGNPSPEGRGGLRDSLEPEGVPLTLGPLGVLGTLHIWIVPGALLGIPGLLIVLFVLVQTAGAAAWIPAIRRLRGTHAPHARATAPG